jgi:hypothetical protein
MEIKYVVRTSSKSNNTAALNRLSILKNGWTNNHFNCQTINIFINKENIYLAKPDSAVNFGEKLIRGWIIIAKH